MTIQTVRGSQALPIGHLHINLTPSLLPMISCNMYSCKEMRGYNHSNQKTWHLNMVYCCKAVSHCLSSSNSKETIYSNALCTPKHWAVPFLDPGHPTAAGPPPSEAWRMPPFWKEWRQPKTSEQQDMKCLPRRCETHVSLRADDEVRGRRMPFLRSFSLFVSWKGG